LIDHEETFNSLDVAAATGDDAATTSSAKRFDYPRGISTLHMPRPLTPRGVTPLTLICDTVPQIGFQPPLCSSYMPLSPAFIGL
jgi:hypothetical protein